MNEGDFEIVGKDNKTKVRQLFSSIVIVILLSTMKSNVTKKKQDKSSHTLTIISFDFSLLYLFIIL